MRKIKAVKIKGGPLRGSLNIPPSKSLSHRAIIAASLSSGSSRIDNIIFSEDILATIDGMKKLGARIEKTGEKTLKIKGGIPLSLRGQSIDCRESGSSLRFLIPLSLVNTTDIIFTGEGRLVDRPLHPYYEIFQEQNIRYKTRDKGLPLEIQGNLKAGEFQIRGDISSQFISGLLFTLPLLEGDSKIKIKGPLESKGYVDLTIDILDKFGIEIKNKDYKEFNIRGCQKYRACDYRVEGDFSQAAFWLVGGVLGKEIRLNDLKLDSIQGDKAIVDIIKDMGGDLSLGDSTIVSKKSKTHGISIDGSQCPDIVPVLTVLAALSQGQTNIVNIGRLRIKESDRIRAISTELNKLGGDVKEVGDSLLIRGKKSLRGGRVESWNDHRIAMSLAIASIACKEDVLIGGADSINKSYPNFWKDFKSLGGHIDEFDMGK